jgi:hypothetical protein
MRFQKSQPAGAAKLVPSSASTGQQKNMDASSTARKAHAHRNSRKSWQHLEHFRAAMARTGRYEEEAPHKAGVGGTAPVCSVELSGCVSS